MPTDTTCFHVAIIGPSDTLNEVDVVKKELAALSTKLSRQGTTISVHHWTSLPPGIGEPQGYIDSGLSWGDIDFVVGIVRSKFGTPVREAKSGTEHEVRLILELNSKTGTPDLLFYFHQDAASSSADVANFVQFLQSRALTASYGKSDELGRMVTEAIRQKIESRASRISGVPKIMGTLPLNRRLSVEWILTAQMRADEKPIPALICFKNGNGEEFIYDCRIPNFQEFAIWVTRSMGFAAKDGDVLLRYLNECNKGNVEKDGQIGQLWLGNMWMLQHNKLGACNFNIALAQTATGKAWPKLKAALQKGVLPFREKQIFIGPDGKKNYII